MRLKEIKPGMVVHCKNFAEKKALLDEAERLGYRWSNGLVPNSQFDTMGKGMTIHFDRGCEYCEFDHITWSDKTEEVTEFSDLILPELAAEEVVPILTEICAGYVKNHDCEGCPLSELEHITNGNECPFTFKDYIQVVEICAQWKSDHEKKEPEIETVDICRIIEVLPDGRKRCVHEEDIRDVILIDGEERKIIGDILKRYCMEHDGEFIAVHETVSRVKAVE